MAFVTTNDATWLVESYHHSRTRVNAAISSQEPISPAVATIAWQARASHAQQDAMDSASKLAYDARQQEAKFLFIFLVLHA